MLRIRRTNRTAGESREVTYGSGMPDPTPEHVRRRMERTARGRDTGAELALRRELWHRGLRGYRVDWPLPIDRRRRADVAWPGRRVAVFVDGCFWHRCPEHFQAPKANAEWWAAKLARNVSRDRDTDLRLDAEGWIVIRAWEHENVASVADRVEAALIPKR